MFFLLVRSPFLLLLPFSTHHIPHSHFLDIDQCTVSFHWLMLFWIYRRCTSNLGRQNQGRYHIPEDEDTAISSVSSSASQDNHIFWDPEHFPPLRWLTVRLVEWVLREGYRGRASIRLHLHHALKLTSSPFQRLLFISRIFDSSLKLIDLMSFANTKKRNRRYSWSLARWQGTIDRGREWRRARVIWVPRRRR